MKKILLALAFTSAGQLVFAQNQGGPPAGTRPAGGPPAGGAPRQLATGAPQPQQGSGRITGTVTDAATKKPVPYATVVLLNPATGKPADGTAADERGKFTMTGVAAGTYTVQISFLGYKSVDKTGITITDAGNTVALGTVALASSAQALKEVVVEGQRSLIEERVDRTVYNAEQDQTTRGGDATDVLKRVPQLTVDLDGNVTLRGNSNVRVLINNKPSTITASSISDALRQIPADEIKSVEVITSPSAKYDAEGSGGIINIVTKKNNLEGKTLSIDTSVGNRGSNLGLNGSIRTGRMGFSLGGWGRAGYNVPGTFSNDQQTYGESGGLISTTSQQASTRRNDVFGRYTLGWDFDINKYNSLAASVRYGLRNGTNYQDDLLTRSDFYGVSGALLRQTGDTRNVRTNDKSNNVDVSLGYTHTTETPQQELSFLGVYSRNNRNNDFTNTITDLLDTAPGASVSPYRLKNLNDSYDQELTLQLDYQTPIGDKQILEVGAKDIMRQANSDYTYLRAEGDNLFEPLTNAGLNNQFNYDQNVAAAYAAYTLNFLKQYTLKAGARYEYTTINAKFANTDTETEIPSYGVLVPSFNLSRRLASGNTLKAAYNRRIQRPSLRFLNPNVQASNTRNATQGNPVLDPEYTNNYELGYNTAIKNVLLNMSAFVRNTTGSIQSVRRPATPDEIVRYELSEGAIFTTFDNIGQENAYGGSLFVNAKIGTKFTLNGGPDFYYAVLRNNVSDVNYNARNKGFVISGRVFGTYNLTDKWSLQAFTFARGREVQLQGYQSGFGVYSLSVRREFAEKRGSIGFGAENFFSPKIPIRTEFTSPLLVQNSENIPNRLNFKINFSYRIGKLSVADAKPRRRRNAGNDDLKEGGDADPGSTPAPQPTGGGGRP
ncbi:TonB-dependent receptor [Hymenobacter sp. BT186]|uniref:TonB-dependent receptor n=1 Tax=Hymenobacter telluris TaxID=2816474 RepID=A0A939ESJ8_9BACT|nr:TonB-dependent receptor [Hymenobacter telluris]MBO0356492.1 TonB-dependent receptor [Hymenobacter telluris]MBW3372516.1 TonB-dependent receptor [Hymenobacter norwichensis]